MNLGRTVWHDERSRDYPAAAGALGQPARWPHGPVLNQGNLGSCTANALIGAVNCRRAIAGRSDFLTETEAVGVYARATEIDPVPGSWPVQDTGSSGLAVAKVAKTAGLIGSYAHCFGVEHVLAALALGPVMIGIPWLNSMFTPVGGRIVVDEKSGVAGGHEVCLIGTDGQSVVTVLNSWGDTWGTGGTATLAVEDLAWLLAQDGDATVIA